MINNSVIYSLISLISTYLAVIISNRFVPSLKISYHYIFYILISYFTLFQSDIKYQNIIIPTILTFGLTICTEVDLRAMLIPRVVTLILQISAPLLCLLTNWYITPWQSIYAGIGAWLITWLIAYIFQLIKGKEGMGLGDADMLAMIAAYLGLLNSIRIIFMSAILGTLWLISSYLVCKILKNRFTDKVPFGPFLALASCLQLTNPELSIKILGW